MVVVQADDAGVGNSCREFNTSAELVQVIIKLIGIKKRAP